MKQDRGELSFDGFDFDFPTDALDSMQDGKYTNTVNIPQYEIKGEKPDIATLYDDSKFQELVQEIESASIPDDVRAFLNVAASRHIVFNYRNIAEYYAQAPAQVQQLMERSALVIIDVDDAIANGYAKLKDEIAALMEKDEENDE